VRRFWEVEVGFYEYWVNVERLRQEERVHVI
jgi:hypothetical protein